MGSCYSGGHIAADRIHTGITICNIEDPQQMYRLGTASNRLHNKWEGGSLNMFHRIQTLTFCFCSDTKHIWSALVCKANRSGNKHASITPKSRTATYLKTMAIHLRTMTKNPAKSQNDF